jgi:hypothetical protein
MTNANAELTILEQEILRAVEPGVDYAGTVDILNAAKAFDYYVVPNIKKLHGLGLLTPEQLRQINDSLDSMEVYELYREEE